LQLERRSVADFTTDLLTNAAYDYTAATQYVTFYGTSQATWHGTHARQPGAHHVSDVYVNDGVNKYWMIGNATGEVRYMKIVEIFEAFADYLGLTLAVNNGSAWSNHHTWDFKYNQGTSYSTGVNDLVAVGIDNLWVISSWWGFSPLIRTTYNTVFGENSPPHAFTDMSAFEMLKRMCISFGLTARIDVDQTTLVRYLAITEAGRITVSGAVNPDNLSDIKIEHNSKSLMGIEVVSPHGRNITRGQTGNATIKIDAGFGTCAGVRFDDGRAVHKLKQASVDVNNFRFIDIDTTERYDFFSCLWVLTNITSKAADEAWSVCVIMPKNGTLKAASNPGNIPEYGEFSSGVQYPNIGAAGNFTNCESNVLAMALAHYYFNDANYADDPVGVYRPQGELITFKVNSLTLGAVNQPILEYELFLHGLDKMIYIDEIEEDLDDGSYTVSGSTLAT